MWKPVDYTKILQSRRMRQTNWIARQHVEFCRQSKFFDAWFCDKFIGLRERRRIFTSLTCGQQAETIQQSAPKLGKLAKVFISLKTNGKLMNVVEGLEIELVLKRFRLNLKWIFSESYEPPEPAQIERLKTRTVRINTKKCPFEEEDLTMLANGPTEIWHQLTHVISSLWYYCRFSG